VCSERRLRTGDAFSRQRGVTSDASTVVCVDLELCMCLGSLLHHTHAMNGCETGRKLETQKSKSLIRNDFANGAVAIRAIRAFRKTRVVISERFGNLPRAASLRPHQAVQAASSSLVVSPTAASLVLHKRRRPRPRPRLRPDGPLRKGSKNRIRGHWDA
jgi:hypothetical protein